LEDEGNLNLIPIAANDRSGGEEVSWHRFS
jgi:hypothetical protein